jgi:ribosomal protein L28
MQDKRRWLPSWQRIELAEKVEDQRTTLKLTFKGAKVTGRFSETDICVDEGKFSAKR